ncbi:MAG TPA: formate dehydrogenase subunit gamma [Syntrophales bacterium]|nr:formate dehydrogenase subunit gamma [Syntrophales bacterium]
MATRTVNRTIGLFVLGSVLVLLMSGILYWQAIGADVSNPRANMWRTVREGFAGFTKVTTAGHKILIVNSGENWREFRNGFLAPFSQWIIAIAVVVMGVFYWRVGPDKLKKPLSGVKIERYRQWERVLHWYTALLFIIMAITGLSLLLGRIFLIPVFGHWADSAYLQAAKVLHNYCGPLFLIGIFLEFIFWVRYNIPKKMDLDWFKNMGGYIGGGHRPHIEKVNAGEKGWFWLIAIFGTAVGITGAILDFPIWGQTRFTMQLSHAIHAIVAVLFVTASLGHIYMGTIGVEGAFQGMWTGSVDTEWAQEHSDLWYDTVMREKGEKTEASS